MVLRWRDFSPITLNLSFKEMNKMKMSKSDPRLCVKSWIFDLPWMQQGVLFSAIRGCDGIMKEDVTKVITRGFRDVVLKCAKSTGSFLSMTPTIEQLDDAMTQLYKSKGFDHYPVHYILHLVHAAEIIGYKHPELHIRNVWKLFYLKMCSAFHMHPESKEEMESRLKDEEFVVTKANLED